MFLIVIDLDFVIVIVIDLDLDFVIVIVIDLDLDFVILIVIAPQGPSAYPKASRSPSSA